MSRRTLSTKTIPAPTMSLIEFIQSDEDDDLPESPHGLFALLDTHHWVSPDLERQYQEQKQLLGLSLAVPLRNQAMMAARKMIEVFVQDVSLEAIGQDAHTRPCFHLTLQNIHEQIDHDFTFMVYVLGDELSMEERQYGWPSKRAWPHHRWSMMPAASYYRQLPAHALMVAAKLSEYGLYPKLGTFWVAEPGPRLVDPILYFQFGSTFVSLYRWD